MSFSAMLLPEFDEEMRNTRKLLELVPEGNYGWKPHDKSMTLGRLAGHVAELPTFAISAIQLESLDLTPASGERPRAFTANSRKELLETFDKNVAKAREALAGANDEQMRHVWSLYFQGKTIFSLPRSAVLRGMVMNHLIHHRAQLGVYLRMNNVAIPGMYGPSADEMHLFAAQST